MTTKVNVFTVHDGVNDGLKTTSFTQAVEHCADLDDGFATFITDKHGCTWLVADGKYTITVCPSLDGKDRCDCALIGSDEFGEPM